MLEGSKIKRNIKTNHLPYFFLNTYIFCTSWLLLGITNQQCRVEFFSTSKGIWTFTQSWVVDREIWQVLKLFSRYYED